MEEWRRMFRDHNERVMVELLTFERCVMADLYKAARRGRSYECSVLQTHLDDIRFRIDVWHELRNGKPQGVSA